MPERHEIRTELVEHVLRVTINRPERGNALAPPQRDELTGLFSTVGDDPSVRAVILTGAGERHFCTGGDLRHEGAAPPTPEGPARPVGEVARLIANGMHRLMNAVLDCDKPVIAAVNGTAAGIGVHLALCCDLVVAVEDAAFIEIFARRGLVADGGGAFLLPRLIGPQRAKELLFLADPVPAADALQMGLVNRVVPRAEFDTTVDELAGRLATGPTVAYGLMKGLVNRSLDQDRGTAFREESLAVELNSRSADFGEGLRAFVERRPVRFTGL